MSDKNKFLAAINEFFGYEIQNIQQFEQDLKGDYDEYHRYQELFNFLYWYERKLTKQESEDKCVGSKSIQEQYKEIAKRNDAYDGEMNLEIALKENKELKKSQLFLGQQIVKSNEKNGLVQRENEELKRYIKNGIELGYIDDREGGYKKFF